MQSEPSKYPKVSQAHMEVWLADAATQAFLQCVQWRYLDVRDAAGSGEHVDSSSADLTHGLLHRALGQQDAYKELADPTSVLNHYEMIEYPEKEDAS